MSAPCLLLLLLYWYIINKLIQPVPCSGIGSVSLKNTQTLVRFFNVLKKLNVIVKIFIIWLEELELFPFQLDYMHKPDRPQWD